METFYKKAIAKMASLKNDELRLAYLEGLIDAMTQWYSDLDDCSYLLKKYIERLDCDKNVVMDDVP